MSKTKLRMLWISLSLALICFIFAKVLDNVNDGKPVPLEYPESNLSQDLFVSQTTTYTQNENLPSTYKFVNVPYDIDVVNGETADIDTGHLVKAADNVAYFLSEFDKESNTDEVILQQYPQTIYMNYSRENSYAQLVKSGTGYINGYYANYFVEHLLISIGNGMAAQNVYMVGYVINPGDDYEENMIVAMATTLDTTEDLQLCKDYVDASLNTLRFDEDTNKIIEAAKKEAEKAAEKEAKEAMNLSYEKEAASNIGASEVSVVVPKDFTDLSIIVSWNNEVSNADLSFCDENGNTIAMPMTVSSKQALFEVGSITTGNYKLQCMNMSGCGEINIRLIEN